MRWIWIDRIIELDKGQRCVAIKNISLAEDVLHDHYGVMPNTLIIEGMAQTAGILVGHAREFAEKVILAKIGKATFKAVGEPGKTLRYTAELDRIDESGASTTGVVELIDPVTGEAELLAEINLMFSHIDQNRAGLEFPEHNFVFTGPLMDLMKSMGV